MAATGRELAHDAVAAVAWLRPELFDWEERRLRCEPTGQLAGMSQLNELFPHSKPSTAPGAVRNSSWVAVMLPTRNRRPCGNGTTFV